jgi:hypothetical protein
MRVDAPEVYRKLPLQLAAMKGVPVVVTDDGIDSAIPQELRNWLVRLRLLEGVPFANLVADTELLPPESIRWFYLDRRWTDALVQGALSVGTVNSDDRTHLAAQYEAIRDELDQEERNYRRRAGTSRFGGKVEAVSGFILRSQAVSGWPAIHVRAFSVDPDESDDATFPEEDPRRMRLLRLERLAPAVLFCMFDGIPQVVHLEEPRQGVQFGFDVEPKGSSMTAVLRPRDIVTFQDVDPKGKHDNDIPVPFRAVTGASGVVDIQELERKLAALGATHVGSSLDSAEYALQLIRFPYRQVFGDPKGVTFSETFMASVVYAEYVAQAFTNGSTP